MKKQFVITIAIVLVLLATPFAALAQSYSFSLDREKVIVFLNEDNSASLDYTFVFTNDYSAHEIDFVDVGMPNNSFDIGSIAARVNDTSVNVSASDYQGNGSGFAVVLGTESIKPGETGVVRVTVEKITSLLTRDAKKANYASFQFAPTWFDSASVHGSTDLTVAFHLPPGVQAEEPRFYPPNKQWPGAREPVIESDESGRITYTWHAENANGHTSYVFGTSFPVKELPPVPTIEPVKPTALPTTSPHSSGADIAGGVIIGGIIVLLIGAGAFLNRSSESGDTRLEYPRPQISIEGYGIRRGLTAVEAAVLLEHPLEKILTMILFGILKKGAAKVTRRDPLELDIATTLPEGLRSYEKNFLDAFRAGNVREREEKLEELFITLIKSVTEKLRGFNRDETQLYYREMIQRAWQQVQEADTPELKNQKFDQDLDWLMLNHRFGENVQKLFQDPGMTTPQWWESYDQGFTLPDTSASTSGHQHEESGSPNDLKINVERSISQPHSEPVPTAKPEPLATAKEVTSAPPRLPGANYAASIVNSVQDFSSRVIRDMGGFTDRVHEATDLRPIYSYWDESRASRRRDEESFYTERGGSSASSEGFFSSLFGDSGSSSSGSSSSSSHRSSSSSSSHRSSCACACAGCACACAGGGR